MKDSRFSGFGLLCLRRDILGTLPSPSQHQVDDDILMTRRVLLPLDDELAKTMTIQHTTEPRRFSNNGHIHTLLTTYADAKAKKRKKRRCVNSRRVAWKDGRISGERKEVTPRVRINVPLHFVLLFSFFSCFFFFSSSLFDSFSECRSCPYVFVSPLSSKLGDDLRLHSRVIDTDDKLNYEGTHARTYYERTYVPNRLLPRPLSASN